ncbi:Transposase DDE domain-containing protein [Halomonas korlensis]|uniref:Transposase DDE domain-containing protein n=1 Tax=Halomonas korlensis TaxID=463301 RepID=A0A1I7KGK7_9GAMM|nr:Transposase DDE domain-containing protein [Halomonas korlensis]
MIEEFVSPPQVMGRPRRDDRKILNGIFWILCSGAKRRDLPERYGPWETDYQRFRQWRDDGTFDQALARLHLRLGKDGLMDLDAWMADSKSSRATRAPGGVGKKGGPEEPVDHADHALGRSRGGLTTKLHLLCDARGLPLSFTLSAGHQADSRHFFELLEQVQLPGDRGRPRKRCRYVVADKGYDSDPLRRYCTRFCMRLIITRRRLCGITK